MNPRVEAVVALITEERERFARFCSTLGGEELARPVPGSSWEVKDFISHVTALERPYRDWMTALAGSATTEPHRGSPGFDVDEYNAAAVATRSGRSVEALLQEAAQERAALIAALAPLDDALLDTMVRFGGDHKRPPREVPLGGLLLGWARHDVIHVADMLKALPERRTDPTVTAWLSEAEVAAAVGAYAQAME